MRLFTGIPLAAEITGSLERLLNRLRPTAPLHWSRSDNLHITTRFIGEWREDRLEELKSALSAVPVPQPFAIAVRGLGWFPNPHAPRVFWAGVEAPPALVGLAKAIESALAGIGVAMEDRPFRPHLTLARVKDPRRAAPVRAAVAKLESTDFGAFEARSYRLYQSTRTAAGSVYAPLAEFSFDL